MKYDPLEVCNGNLAYAERERAASYEKTAIHLYEKMLSISKREAKFSPDLPNVFSSVLERSTGAEVAFCTADYVKPLTEREKREEYMVAANILHNIYGTEHISRYVPSSVNNNNTVAYFSNPLSDEAFLAFAGTCRSLEGCPSSGFAASCEDVYYGKAGYCILPVESIADGRLAGMYSLIDRYELKAVASVTVRMGEGGAMRFFLLSKYTEVIECPKMFRTLEMKVECTAGALKDMVFAADYFGLEIANTEKIPIEDQTWYYISLMGEDEALARMVYFLFLSEKSGAVMGICDHIRTV